MNPELKILLITALSLGFIHTVLGPDHYLPFVAMAGARKWPKLKTFLVTFLCGLGHIFSSVAIGAVGITFGIAVFKLEGIEAARGDLAAWLLLIFGFTYCVWGIRRAIANKPHTHLHPHKNNLVHVHQHSHSDEHVHVHQNKAKPSLTPWILFTIFVFGPCEPLIPLLMYPAAKGNSWVVVGVVAAFGASTIATMLVMVFSLSFSVSKLPIARFERYSHALAGFVIFLSGGAIKFLGL
jgi:nickel/cobalt transporter (NicO) family protein